MIERDNKCIVNVSSLYRPLSPMESLNTFESEMEADGQGNYSLFPALDSIASLSGTAETLERLLKNNVILKYIITVSYTQCRLSAYRYRKYTVQDLIHPFRAATIS